MNEEFQKNRNYLFNYIKNYFFNVEMLKIKKIRYHRWFNTAEERFSNHKVRPTGIIQTEVQVYTRTHTDTHTDYLKKK